jgi:MoaA/NifB/PqqE/SkfB family radical SAM enzyme
MENIIPTQVQIETVAGYCNSKCIMCPIARSRKKEIMTNDIFEKIVYKLLPIKNNIKIFTLLGLGETLLDPHTSEKIKIAKDHNFTEVGIFTNGMNLTEDQTIQLLSAGIDVFIFSIDGFSSAVYEKIRMGLKLERIINNIDFLLKEREKQDKNVKIIIRFTRQEINYYEWDDFLKFWSKKLNKKYGDMILAYDVNNAGDDLQKKPKDAKILPNIYCGEIYKFKIFSDGEIGFCCGDQFGEIHIGNILYEDPIELYNHALFKHYREEIKKGNISNLKLCENCTVATSVRESKHIFL